MNCHTEYSQLLSERILKAGTPRYSSRSSTGGGEYYVETKGELQTRYISQMLLVRKGWNFSKGLLRQMTTHCVREKEL